MEKNKLTLQSKHKGIILHTGLKNIAKKFPNLFKVYGKGLIAAMVFNTKINKINYKLRLVVEESMKKGLLLCYTGRESIKIGPPLTISKEAIIEGLAVIDESLKKIFSHG